MCSSDLDTYEQIKNYVLEKHGFKVSTLYISQVKRKYGLDVREHYNMSKNGKQKIPQCPIEKEEAILDALKYFKMTFVCIFAAYFWLGVLDPACAYRLG